jgi:hypothetical protein
LEKRAEQVLPGSEGGWGEGWGWGKVGEMTQTMYIHTNKWINNKKILKNKNLKNFIWIWELIVNRMWIGWVFWLGLVNVFLVNHRSISTACCCWLYSFQTLMSVKITPISVMVVSVQTYLESTGACVMMDSWHLKTWRLV